MRISTDPAAGSAGYFPFTVGIGSRGKPFVHVLDEFTLDVLFGELDTVSDFVAYLRKKEQFLSNKDRVVSVDGEEQLLGIYLKQMNTAGEHDIVLPSDIPPDLDGIYLQEGVWEEVSKSPQLRRKKEADRISYAWDNLIERFIELGDPKILGIEIDLQPNDIEIALRAMAAESRLSRRHLAHAFLGVLSRSNSRKPYARVVMSDTFQDAAYIFLAEPKPENETYDDYRKYRVARLLAYCKVAVLRAPNAKHIVGIAFDSVDPSRKGGSEDLLYINVSARTPEMLEEAKIVQDKFEILLERNVKTARFRGQEYPITPEAESLIETKECDTGTLKERATKRKWKTKIQKESKRKNRANRK